MENSRNARSSSAELGMSVCLLVQHLHRQQGKAGVLLKAEVKEGPAAAQGSIRWATAARQPGPPWSRQGNGVEPRVHMHTGWEGGEGGGRQGGGWERAIWEQGQERRSWQWPHSAKQEPLARLGRKESAEGRRRTRRLSLCPRRRHCPPRMTGVQRTPSSAEGARHARGRRARGGRAGDAGPALDKVARKTHEFQFLEAGFPGAWSAGCGSFLLQSFKSELGPGWRGWLCRPHSRPASGYTSVEKYSVFRLSSAKEMGGCCR